MYLKKAGVSYGDLLNVKIRKQGQEEPVFSGEVPFCDSFGSVAEGEPLLMVSETLQIQIAINYEKYVRKIWNSSRSKLDNRDGAL